MIPSLFTSSRACGAFTEEGCIRGPYLQSKPVQSYESAAER
jgi:hypothetical protein